ncbi:MAG TPA: stage II sporulation protein M [Gammaproteobacteria bacterium]|nr:stage II sporulation protein M [Gammaproteobacteria bacterium]
MKQQQFEQRHRAEWSALEEQLVALEDRSRDADPAALPALYRRACQHLALATDRHYSPALVAYLRQLVVRGHQHLYRTRRRWLPRLQHFLGAELPLTLRAEWRLLVLAAVLLFLPAAVMGAACYAHGELVYSLLNESQVSRMESMYDPANHHLGRGEDRQSASDFLMFGFYIRNNTGIGFRTFAGGLLFGLGTVTALLFNGLFLGAVAGHLTRLGFSATFWPFVAGHGAFEFTAILLSGTAGLQLARALYAPGRRGRLGALRATAAASVTLIVGAALLFLLAAFVEAFWSSRGDIPGGIKLGVAAGLWLLVAGYFTLAGRGRDGP